ncbi:hypothetical protein HYX19_03470 [Candidatus Woesearchaeota archaeon]|nr:hypothetical protein [Candidatus Woesearchaeota archaeon]
MVEDKYFLLGWKRPESLYSFVLRTEGGRLEDLTNASDLVRLCTVDNGVYYKLTTKKDEWGEKFPNIDLHLDVYQPTGYLFFDGVYNSPEKERKYFIRQTTKDQAAFWLALFESMFGLDKFQKMLKLEPKFLQELLRLVEKKEEVQ